MTTSRSDFIPPIWKLQRCTVYGLSLLTRALHRYLATALTTLAFGVVSAIVYAEETSPPVSSLRLTVRYSFDSTVNPGGPAGPPLTEYVSGRVRTGVLTPFGEFVQTGVSQYDSTAGHGEYLHEDAFWRVSLPQSGLELQAGDLTAGHAFLGAPSVRFSGIQLRRGAGARAIETIEALTPEPAAFRNVDPGSWSWDALSIASTVDGPPLGAGSSAFSVQFGHLRGDHSLTTHADRVAAGRVRYGLPHEVAIEAHAGRLGALRHRALGLIVGAPRWGRFGLSSLHRRAPGYAGTHWSATFDGSMGAVRYFAGAQQQRWRLADPPGGGQRYSSMLDMGSSYRRAYALGLSTPSWVADSGRLRINYLYGARFNTSATTTLLNVAHAAPLARSGRWYAGGFADLDEHQFGVFLGLSMPLGRAAPSALRPSAAPIRRPAVSTLRQGPVSVSGFGSYDPQHGVRIESSLSRKYAEELLRVQ